MIVMVSLLKKEGVGRESISITIVKNKALLEPCREKTCFSHVRTTKVHPRSLISTFVFRYLDSTIPILAKSKIPRL